MATRNVPDCHAAAEVPFITAFNALPDREALRLFQMMAHRFSHSRGHDQIYDGILTVAFDSADNEGFRGDDLAARYLEAPTRFGPSFGRPVLLTIEGGR